MIKGRTKIIQKLNGCLERDYSFDSNIRTGKIDNQGNITFNDGTTTKMQLKENNNRWQPSRDSMWPSSLR